LSWGGFAALQVAARRPPELAAIVTLCSTDDRYADDAHYMGGCLLGENAVWGAAIFAIASLPPDPALVGEEWRAIWRRRLENTPEWVPTWLAHQRRDGYWRHGSVCENYGSIACPVYAIGGWADAYSNTVPRLLEHLRVPAKGLVGPWAHGWPLMATPGPSIGFLQEVLRWWDHWLKGVDTGIMDEPAYRVWLQDPTPRRAGREEQPGRWVAEAGWPSARISARRLHLNPGRLEAVPAPEAALSHRSPLYAGSAAGAWCPYGTGSDLDTDQREDDGRSLTFDSAPLTETFDLLGPPELALELAVDRPIAQIAARLCDIDETGASARVTYGVINLTHRDSHETPAPLEPGKRYRVRLALNQVAYRFPPGHRLRLALSTSYWPTLWPAPEPVLLTVYTGASRISLPMRPPRAEDAMLPPFGEPEGASPPAMTTLSPDRRSRTFRHDLAADVAELIIESDDGEERLDHLGLSSRAVIREHYRIAGDDPLSAEARYDWTIFLRRDAWRIHVEARTTMSATATEFVVGLELAAFEGDERVFERRWDRRIARDLV
jgi:uncharacterized protein